MPDFSPVIRDAYRDILEREPDPGGLANYDRLMNQGMAEAEMREALLRSLEFAIRNPDRTLPNRLGLNVHVPSNPMIDDVAANLGMRWVRLDFDWFRLEPTQGAFDWWELDRVVARAHAQGVEMLATLAYTPAWASANPTSPHISDPPAQRRFWTDFVGQAVGRYPQIRHWQFWNEPNVREFWSGSPVQYRAEILEPAAALVRSIDPTLRVVAPGLANLRGWRDWFREALLAVELIDVVNHHNYASSGREAILALERDTLGQPSLRTLIQELGAEGKPFWLTETGLRSDRGDQRRYYEEVVDTLSERTWVDRVFFFHYWDGPGQGNGGFGIVNEDFTPKPAYLFLQSILRPAAAAVTGRS